MTVPQSPSSDGSSDPPALEEPNVALERVRNHSLPADSIRLVESYEEIVGDRDRFLWKWAHHLFPAFSLSSVAPEYAERTRDGKLAALMFVSILDDVAEKHQDRATYEEAAKIPFDHRSVDHERDGVDADVLSFASEVWERFEPTVSESPRRGEFEDIFRFDLEQVLNAMKYSFLANQNIDFVTGSELRTYDAHNMMLFGFANIDLVHSPTFESADLSTLRTVIERAQRMVRIGNWITTWEREVAEGDFTSGIVVYALERDIVSAADLRAIRTDSREEDVERIIGTIREHDVEDVFLARWRAELAEARAYESEIDTVDIEAYLDGIETVMEYHLASRGLK
ncbi:hypothetical protein Halru_2224 [Halovivax ruber XH-70]|uniref:Geranylgeranyl pyrophosphate synthase n=1 Tax=Halovivax ruber (strain DSM 18193 / JCM 13892 / XH-70) TaxID=797302 RepID=L0IF41_HALRX|nr:hypothetical protein [Halovivax ruber]AGB16811.1 hypothetical protein Halru_2224 [Halovivax ruber XH-70]